MALCPKVLASPLLSGNADVFDSLDGIKEKEPGRLF